MAITFQICTPTSNYTIFPQNYPIQRSKKKFWMKPYQILDGVITIFKSYQNMYDTYTILTKIISWYLFNFFYYQYYTIFSFFFYSYIAIFVDTHNIHIDQYIHIVWLILSYANNQLVGQ